MATPKRFHILRGPYYQHARSYVNGRYVELDAGWWVVDYQSINARTGRPWQSVKHKLSRSESEARRWIAEHSGGQARNRGGMSLSAERRRRIADAQAQPRTPDTKQRFWFKTFHRRPPVRRRPLDEVARQEYAERDYELEQSIDGLKVAIGHVRDDLARDVYDRGRRVDYRHVPKTRLHQFSATGRRLSVLPEVGFDTAEREARARIRELNDELRAAREERKSIADVMKHGELPGHYRKRLAWRRTRARRRGR